jgi:hypothetical protein
VNAEVRAAKFRERSAQTYGDRTAKFIFTPEGVRVGAVAGFLAGIVFVAVGISELMS